MTTYRNVRVKMKGGKTRIQRAMVLASGKFKFVKNLTRHRSASKGAKPSKTKSRSYMTRRKKHHSRGSSLMQSGERIAKVGALLAPATMHLLSSGSGYEKAKWITRDYSGFNADSGRWEPGYLLRGWGPVVGVSLASIAFHKIMSLIRRA